MSSDREASPASDTACRGGSQHIDHEQRRIRDGGRPYLPSDVLDHEAARPVGDPLTLGPV
ncbi:hypothetical protein [Saccharopolyspora shandongensis]|uniref:hypothetical protein n=1 Tax=Saccharopolyspora shandongensis TaxID=418495 RepID=UPI0033EF8DD3